MKNWGPISRRHPEAKPSIEIAVTLDASKQYLDITPLLNLSALRCAALRFETRQRDAAYPTMPCTAARPEAVRLVCQVRNRSLPLPHQSSVFPRLMRIVRVFAIERACACAWGIRAGARWLELGES